MTLLASPGVPAPALTPRDAPRRTPPHAVGANSDRLGQQLLKRGLLSEAELSWAIDVQAKNGCRLGEILIASGLVPRLEVGRTLAQLWGLQFVDLTVSPIDESLLGPLDVRQCFSEQWVPLRFVGLDLVLVATSEQPSAELTEKVASALGTSVEFAVTTPWDIGYSLRDHAAPEMLEEATLGLWRRDGERSARRVLTRRQRWIGIGLLAALGLGAAITPLDTATGVLAAVTVAFFVSVAFKFMICLFGARLEQREEISQADVAALRDADLPVYTVLVPMFREAEVVGDLLRNLARLDYPRERLEILLLLEADDAETRAAIVAAEPPEYMTMVTVPPGAPQTKPKACNVGLYAARGEYLVIYDAEDRPEADQLKMAVIAFQRGGEDLACVQAALNYFNSEQNALTRMFTLEYSFWFDYMLPGLEALNLPIPLGGTSNHFRTQLLRRLGGWDPFNVTEDADLGIRSAALGQKVGVIPSTTYEEANSQYRNFVRQRSRWIKGYLQTTLVYLRHPLQLWRQVGTRPLAGFALLIGGTPASFLLAPPLYVLFAISLVTRPGWLTAVFPGWVLWLSLSCLILGNSLMIYVSMLGAFKRRRYALALWALANPLYWLLHSIAAYRGLWQLVTRPHYWEKTCHGLATDAHAADGGRDQRLQIEASQPLAE